MKNSAAAGSGQNSATVQIEQQDPTPPPPGTVTITISVPAARVLERVIGERVNGNAFLGLYYALRDVLRKAGHDQGHLPRLTVIGDDVIDIRALEKAVGF